MDSCQITQWCARFIREQVKPGDLCFDEPAEKNLPRYLYLPPEHLMLLK